MPTRSKLPDRNVNALKPSWASTYGLPGRWHSKCKMAPSAVNTDRSVPESHDHRRRTVLAAAGSIAPSRDADSKAHTYMKRPPRKQPDQEPVGIVISRGSRHEDLPTVWAYVWGPAPDDSEVSSESP